MAAIAGRDDFYCAGLAAILQRELAFSGAVSARSFGELAAVLADQSPVCLILVAAGLPGFHDEAKAIRLLRQICPGARLIVTGAEMERNVIVRLLAAGVHGFLPRTLPVPDLIDAMRLVVSGQIFVPPTFAEMHPASGQRLAIEETRPLTRRQTEIVQLLAAGMSNKVIARNLSISPATVKVHVNAAFRILDVHDRKSAVRVFSETIHAAHFA